MPSDVPLPIKLDQLPLVARTDIRDVRLVSIEAQAPDGLDLTIEAEGLLSRCLQHEIDHINGILFIDKIPQSEKMLLRDDLGLMEYKYAKTHAS